MPEKITSQQKGSFYGRLLEMRRKIIHCTLNFLDIKYIEFKCEWVYIIWLLKWVDSQQKLLVQSILCKIVVYSNQLLILWQNAINHLRGSVSDFYCLKSMLITNTQALETHSSNQCFDHTCFHREELSSLLKRGDNCQM